MSKEKSGAAAAKGENDIPVLHKIQPKEVQDIKNMFNLLCVDNSNRINQYLAIKLFRNLGLDVSQETLPPQLTFKDFLIFADAAAPDDNPEGGAKTINCLISQNSDGSPGDITPQDLINFSLSLGKPPPSLNEARIYLSMLQEYDECDDVPLAAATFQKELVRQTKLAILNDDL